MNPLSIVFIASTEYDSLGIGYLASALISAGFKIKVIDFLSDKADVLRDLKRLSPIIVGFSVIYQYHLRYFIDLVSYLREGGISCHFTAGGHYASLKPEELFSYIPAIDSIVRFEGENTINELALRLKAGNDWKCVNGLAFMKNGKITFSPSRPFEKDLDKFPYPFRPPLKKFAFGIKFTTIIAGRGCIHNCSFCNIRKFYHQGAAVLKRIRRPEMVVNEMALLYKTRGCSIFLFLDDDFPVTSQTGSDWIIRFCHELKRKGFDKKILWKISCRPDEVDEETFSLMKNCGLFTVFLGIEDGTDEGLEGLNKNMTVAESLRGIRILKKLQIGFDYGFMLFQPWSTFKTINDNIAFLENIIGDGYAPVNYLKLMPYYETSVEKQLIHEGRLKISEGIRDYDFIDQQMNLFYNFTADCFREWLHHACGLENLIHWTVNYFQVYERFFDIDDEFLILKKKLRSTISQSNRFLLNKMKELSSIFESGMFIDYNQEPLKTLKEVIFLKHLYFKKKILSYSDMISDIALNTAVTKLLKIHPQ